MPCYQCCHCLFFIDKGEQAYHMKKKVTFKCGFAFFQRIHVLPSSVNYRASFDWYYLINNHEPARDTSHIFSPWVITFNIHARTYACICVRMCVYVWICKHTYTNARTRARGHTHTHIYLCTRKGKYISIICINKNIGNSGGIITLSFRRLSLMW